MRGTIAGISHVPGSGIATLVIRDEVGDICHVHADAGPLFRAMLESALHVGDEVEFTTTYLGTMDGLSVVGDGAP